MAGSSRDRQPVKDRARNLFRTRFTCCGRTWRGHRAVNAHHIARHSGMWMSKKARAAARSMGKDWDRARRHAMGWLRAAGLRDERGKLTDRARSRPEIRGRVTRAQLRAAHRHDRAHERAARHDARAQRLRSRWPQRPAPGAARPATARVNGNGSRPQPPRTPPGGRLAPASRNGRTTP